MNTAVDKSEKGKLLACRSVSAELLCVCVCVCVCRCVCVCACAYVRQKEEALSRAGLRQGRKHRLPLMTLVLRACQPGGEERRSIFGVFVCVRVFCIHTHTHTHTHTQVHPSSTYILTPYL